MNHLNHILFVLLSFRFITLFRFGILELRLYSCTLLLYFILCYSVIAVMSKSSTCQSGKYETYKSKIIRLLLTHLIAVSFVFQLIRIDNINKIQFHNFLWIWNFNVFFFSFHSSVLNKFVTFFLLLEFAVLFGYFPISIQFNW